MHRFRFLVAVALALKFVLATATPLGYDFVRYMSMALALDTVPSSPWILMIHYIYAAWLSLPIEHGDFLAAVSTAPHVILPSHYLLTAMVKIPLVTADFASAFLVYSLGVRLDESAALARKSVIVWLANPFTTFFIEMWGSIDVFLVALSLAGILLAFNEHAKSSAASIGVGILLRVSPIITWLTIGTWLRREKSTAWNYATFVMAGLLGLVGYMYWVTEGNATQLTLLLQGAPLYTQYSPVTFTFSSYSFRQTSLGGLTIIVVTLLYLIALDIWPRTIAAIIGLELSAILLLYSLADWIPTAFLWAIPFITLWRPSRTRLRYAIVFHVLVLVYILFFFGSALNAGGSSFLFIPLQNAWLSQSSLAPMQSTGEASVFLSLLIRSIVSGFCIAYSAITIYDSFHL
jgi:hypothetical protein